jgi:hypothetical protein
MAMMSLRWMMTGKSSLRVFAVTVVCFGAIPAPVAADEPEECYRTWNPDAEQWPGYNGYVIVADDVHVAPGCEDREILEITVEVINGFAQEADFWLYVYEPDPDSGLPGDMIYDEFLVHLGYFQWRAVTLPGGGIMVPDDGFLWVGVQASVYGAGWIIANQEAEIGSSDDLYAVDMGLGFEYEDFGPNTISNLQLIITVPGDACPADFDGDGDVDTADLLFLLGAWGTPDGDVDGDSDTDTADLLALLAAWGECP